MRPLTEQRGWLPVGLCMEGRVSARRGRVYFGEGKPIVIEVCRNRVAHRTARQRVPRRRARNWGGECGVWPGNNTWVEVNIGA